MNKETTLLNDKDNLIADNMNLVHYFVKKIKLGEIRFYDYDDIFQIGSIGLIKAANTYNGITKFSTYASRCINNEIYMFFRNKNRFELIKYLDEPVCKNEDDEEITLLELIPNGIGVYDEVQKLLDIESVYNVLLNNFSYDNILLMLYTANSKKQKFGDNPESEKQFVNTKNNLDIKPKEEKFNQNLNGNVEKQKELIVQ